MTLKCASCGGTIVDQVCEDCGKPVRKNVLVSALSSDAALDASAGPATAGASPDVAAFTTTHTTRNTARFTVNYPTRVGAAGGGTRRRRATATTGTSTRRKALGGGLISLPDQLSQDPLKLVLDKPEVSLSKRRCPKCDGQVNRTKGYCPHCTSPYDFEPKLQAGERVGGKIEVKGPIAFGGLGWIYLGWDTVLNRWVVLKGLLNSADEASAAAAVAERRYLAAVKHPQIVGIFDFVQEKAEGYIVMEYVGGVTVQRLREQRGPLPVDEAIAYVLGILPAFSYLHRTGLVYCDMKPDNLMLEGEGVKLIDMGAVRKIDDPHGDIFATHGFCAPEAGDAPSVVSDLYTLGRTLAVLIMDFKFGSAYAQTLPTPDEAPVLADNESLYRFLLRATHADPDERFQSADEMAEQLFGVLREIVSLKTGPKPADSQTFTQDRLIAGTASELISHCQPTLLPSLRIRLDDPAAPEVVRVMSLMDASDQLEQLRALVGKYGDRSVETRLRLAEVLIGNEGLIADEERHGQIDASLAAIELADPFEWRTSWMRGVHRLNQGLAKEARAFMEKCYFEVPGELAPRLGMAMACELEQALDLALAYYERVGLVDPMFISAHAGAARCLARLGRPLEAIDALQRVPQSHALKGESRLAIAQLVVDQADQASADMLLASSSAVSEPNATRGDGHEVVARLCALAARLSPRLAWPAGQHFLGQAFEERGLRSLAEQHYRAAARTAASEAERCRLVVSANQVRPLTWI